MATRSAIDLQEYREAPKPLTFQVFRRDDYGSIIESKVQATFVTISDGCLMFYINELFVVGFATGQWDRFYLEPETKE